MQGYDPAMGGQPPGAPGQQYYPDPSMQGYDPAMGGMTPNGMAGMNPDGTMVNPAATAVTNEYSTITLVCRAVDVAQQQARQIIPFALQAELNASPLFDPATTVLSPQVTPDDATSTFSFGVTLGLKSPLKH